MMRFFSVATSLIVVCVLAAAQQNPGGSAKDRAKFAKELGRSGSESIPQLTPLLSDPDREVRIEVVKSLISIGTQHSIDPLIQATRDNDPEIQIRATDGIVNFYLPGYLQSSALQRFGTAVRSRFDREDTRAVDPYVIVREDAVAAIGRLVSGGVGMEVRANAARAAGILRGKGAVPELLEALQTKDTNVIYESLLALQKIGDQSAGPRVVFLLRDLEERVQIAAIETAALLRAKEAVPELQKVYNSGRSDKIRAAALGALAMLPDESSRPLFQSGFTDRNDAIRASAAEGFARLKNPSDREALTKAFNEERKMGPRLAMAFGMVSLGHTATGEYAPLMYLVNTLNSKSYRNVAQPYLTELAREEPVRQELYRLMKGTDEEKMGIARVLAASGDQASVPHLQAMTKDPEVEVAQEAIRSLRNLQARLH